MQEKFRSLGKRYFLRYGFSIHQSNITANKTLKNVTMKEKKTHYNKKILNVNQRSFTLLVMSANGGFEIEWKHFYAKPSEKIAEKDGRYRCISGLC